MTLLPFQATPGRSPARAHPCALFVLVLLLGVVPGDGPAAETGLEGTGGAVVPLLRVEPLEGHPSPDLEALHRWLGDAPGRGRPAPGPTGRRNGFLQETENLGELPRLKPP